MIVLLSLDGNKDAEPEIDSRIKERSDIINMFENLKAKDNDKYKDKVIVEYIESTPFTKIKKTVEDIYTTWQTNYNESPDYVLHYTGHAVLDKEVGKLVIKDDQSGKAEWLEDQKFAALFNADKLNVQQPSMVCFQACDSAKVGTIQVDLRGVGYEFTKLNIPAVIGMQNEINSPSSCAFFDQLYTNILEGKDVAEAVTAGRDYLGREYNAAAAAYSNNSFGSPVLFITTEEPVTLLTSPKPSQPEKTIEVKHEFTSKPSDSNNRASVQAKENENLLNQPVSSKGEDETAQRHSASQDISENSSTPGKQVITKRETLTLNVSPAKPD